MLPARTDSLFPDRSPVGSFAAKLAGVNPTANNRVTATAIIVLSHLEPLISFYNRSRYFLSGAAKNAMPTGKTRLGFSKAFYFKTIPRF
jgi:hypothetical protein